MEVPPLKESVRTIGSTVTIVLGILFLFGNPYNLPPWSMPVMGVVLIALAVAVLCTDYKPWKWRSAGRAFFVGQWDTDHGSAATGTFVITLRNDGTADKDHVRQAHGDWEYIRGVVRIRWSDGWMDILRRIPEGVVKIAYDETHKSAVHPKPNHCTFATKRLTP